MGVCPCFQFPARLKNWVRLHRSEREFVSVSNAVTLFM